MIRKTIDLYCKVQNQQHQFAVDSFFSYFFFFLFYKSSSVFSYLYFMCLNEEVVYKKKLQISLFVSSAILMLHTSIFKRNNWHVFLIFAVREVSLRISKLDLKKYTTNLINLIFNYANVFLCLSIHCYHHRRFLEIYKNVVDKLSQEIMTGHVLHINFLFNLPGT